MPPAVISPRIDDLASTFALHAPDGFLSVGVALLMWLLTIIVLAVSVARAEASLDERAVPLMGVTAAFIFAAQMVNFPVAGGTSGHLLGGVLAAILLGPWVGTLVMASVVAVQALVFQDGGLVVLGANIFNMGIDGDTLRVRRLRGPLPAARRRGARTDAGRGHRGLVGGHARCPRHDARAGC